MEISPELFLDHLNAKLIRSWFPGRSANFNLVSSRENLTVASAIFCIVCFEALARGLDDVSNYLLQCTDVPVIRLLFPLCPSIIYCLCPCVFCIIKLVIIFAFGLLVSISEWMSWKEVVPILVASMGQTKAGWWDRPSTTLFCNASFILPLTVIPNLQLLRLLKVGKRATT